MNKITNLEIPIKPFSVNKAWVGRRFKTPEYKQWRSDFSFLCKRQKTIIGMFEIEIDFHIKNFKMVDTDNFCKSTMDSLTENDIIEDDRFAKKITLEKFKVQNTTNEKIVIRICKSI